MRRRNRSVYGVDREDALQKFTNDYLDAKGIRYIRIPDGIFSWVNSQAPLSFRIWFNWTFAGMPDNLCLIPSGEYAMALCLELKSRCGKLHGRQKAEARKLNWVVCRTPEDVITTVDRFLELTTVGGRQ